MGGDDKDEVTEAQRVAGEAYQVIGAIAARAGLYDQPDVQRALDYFSGNLEGSILPFEFSIGSELEQCAVVERQFIKDDIYWLRAGAKLTSPSGDNISEKRIADLEARLEHLNRALRRLPA